MLRGLARLRSLSLGEGSQLVALGLYTQISARVPPRKDIRVSADEAQRWFGPVAPSLYHSGFGRTHQSHVPPSEREPGGEAAAGWTAAVRDPRLQWELERDQDLAVVAKTALAVGKTTDLQRDVSGRLQRFVESTPPNAMEATLRCISWLEVGRVFAQTAVLNSADLCVLATRLIQLGQFIARRMYEVPLGGNHYLAHATGLLYLGLLLPGHADSSRWAARGRRILERQVLRQFRADGGGYEQSTGYHLFSLELLLGCSLLLHSQGREWPAPVQERIRQAAHFAGALARPDGSVPHLGDDDSGRLHRWGRDPAVSEILALAAVLFDDPQLARAAGRATEALGWLGGEAACDRLEVLASQALTPPTAQCFPATGLYVLRDAPNCHLTVWSRNPRSPAMVAHAHSDHNSVDIWIGGTHTLRDPGTGVYLGDLETRNLLRATPAHNTIAVDGVEVNPFPQKDPFFMPANTHGRCTAWHEDASFGTVTVTHDGFRDLRGGPCHQRTVCLDVERGLVAIIDQVSCARPRGVPALVEAWWHWGAEPSDERQDTLDGAVRWSFRVGGVAAQLYLPAGTEFTLSEPFPWSPRYGVVLPGRRSVIRQRAPLPFRMVLHLSYAEPKRLARVSRRNPPPA